MLIVLVAAGGLRSVSPVQAEGDKCTSMTEDNSKKVKEWSARLGALLDGSETVTTTQGQGGGNMPTSTDGSSMIR